MSNYPIHTLESAPESSKPALSTLQRTFGFIPNIAGVIAGSTVLLNGFAGLFEQVHAGTLTEPQIQTLLLTNAVANQSAWPVAFHTALALKTGVDAADVQAIREGHAPRDAQLAALSALTNLDAPELAPVQRALDAILRQQEPFPAVVMNRYWDILRVNGAAKRFFQFLLGSKAATLPNNVLRRLFDPSAVRPLVANWGAYAEALVQRVHRECVGGVPDERTRTLLSELLAYPGVPRSWRRPDPSTPVLPWVPITFIQADHRFDYFSTVTTLGTPQDITLQEIRIECFYPVDGATEAAARRIGTGD